jgi:hypothetical protein
LTSGEVHAKAVVKEFDLSTGIEAGLWAIAGTGPVRGRQLIRQWHNGNIGGPVSRWEAKKRPLLKVG